MPREPFDMLRAAFFLLAALFAVEMFATIMGALLCWWMNYTTIKIVGACQEVVQQIRELWGEMATAILALLLAARVGGPPPPPPPRDDQQPPKQ